MTRKKYDKDDDNEDFEYLKTRRVEDVVENDSYRDDEDDSKERYVEFEIKNFDMLFDMFYDIKNNKNNTHILEICKLLDFSNFIENPIKYEDDQLESIYTKEEISYDLYNKLGWYEENKPELKSHYKCLKKYKLFDNQKITFQQFANFCYCYS